MILLVGWMIQPGDFSDKIMKIKKNVFYAKLFKDSPWLLCVFTWRLVQKHVCNSEKRRTCIQILSVQMIQSREVLLLKLKMTYPPWQFTSAVLETTITWKFPELLIGYRKTGNGPAWSETTPQILIKRPNAKRWRHQIKSSHSRWLNFKRQPRVKWRVTFCIASVLLLYLWAYIFTYCMLQ